MIFKQSFKPNSKKNELLYEINRKAYTNYHIKTYEYKRINYDNGYYIVWVFYLQRHGEGNYYFNNGDYYIGEFSYDKFNGKGKYYYNNGDYKD